MTSIADTSSSPLHQLSKLINMKLCLQITGKSACKLSTSPFSQVCLKNE